MSQDMKLLHSLLAEIEDEHLLALIGELGEVSGIAPAEHYTLYKYTWQCVYPGGAGDRRYPIDRNRVNPLGLLSRKIKKLQGTLIYQFCDELALMTRNEGAELVENMTLYVFLNRYLPVLNARRKPVRFDPRVAM